MRIGLWLPTFAPERPSTADRSAASLARRAEQLGYSSIWVIDHVLPTTGTVHTGSWYDPLISLAAVAAATSDVELGTASLVAGPRDPVSLAKQLATLASIAGPRVSLGASSGWSQIEYEASGFKFADRASLTDEVLAAVRGLLDHETFGYQGDFVNFPEIRLVPRPAWHVPILVGGGSRIGEAGSGADRSHMAASVLARIARHDGWLAPCAGAEATTISDLAIVNAAVGAKPFRRVHVQWTHVVDTSDQVRAHREQLPAVRRVMGADRSDESLLSSYLLGTSDEITSRIERIRDAGFDDLVIGPVSADPHQIEMIAQIALGVARRAPQSRTGQGTP